MHDVIVVGAGGSGLAAAVSAAECGCRVLVLEKRPAPGGTTGIAVGSFTANQTRLQRAAGLEDDPVAHDADAGKFSAADIEARNHSALRAHFLRHSAEALHWLMDMGLTFHGPSPEPPNRVPRMHNVVPGAKAYIAALQMRLTRLGGEVLCDAAVMELLRADGRVCGVRALVHGAERELHATRGVVLAAGDYANSPELIARHKGERFANIEGINPHATGDGHRLAQAAGARLLNMDITYGPELRFVAPPGRTFQQLLPTRQPWAGLLGRLLPLVPRAVMHAFIRRLLVTWQHPENALFDDGAILLNRAGERFCNERIFPDRELAIAAQPGKTAYILLDERLAERYSRWPHFVSTAPQIAYAYVADYARLRPDITLITDSLETLATRRGLPAQAVRQSVEAFNRHAATRTADAFGRPGDCPPLAGRRWVLLGPAKAWFTTTEGGAAITERCEVLGSDGAPIPGLYAVGQNGLGGQVLWGHGLHIGWALTSGYLVGRVLGNLTSLDGGASAADSK
ncbi:MAG: FAD-binding dehydrogenase [Pedosphaera sp. Tous-C6FEB]|nr:MAG: FAD-binding dehydrogenase [Pedosphaera sp. Tous-C6FEB]